MRRYAVASACCAMAAMLAAGCSASGSRTPGQHGPSSRPTGSASGSPTAAPGRGAGTVGVLGSYRVGQRWITFTEPAHTGPTGAGLGPRELLTQIRYPLTSGPVPTQPAKGPFPLLIFAPGFMQCGAPYDRMLHAWATAGYVVVVVNFPHSDCKVGTAATEADMVNQPGDMSYVITRMLGLSAAAHGLFSGLLDSHEIAVTGQSDGGDTVAAIGANSCCIDHRIVAVAPLSGSPWPPMPGKYFVTRPVPMLFVQGTADVINYPGCSVMLYHGDPTWARYYLNLFGASHTKPYWGTNAYERVVVRVTLAFFNRYVLGRVSAGPAMARAGNVHGLAALYSHGGGPLANTPCND